MKAKHTIIGLLVCTGSLAVAENLPEIVQRFQKKPFPALPAARTGEFVLLQKKALDGDQAAQRQISTMLESQMTSIYSVVSKSGGLVFSLRKPRSGFYDSVTDNYALNIEKLFADTADTVVVKKRDFEVHTTGGETGVVRLLKYRLADESIEIQKNGQPQWIALTNLTDSDRFFVKSGFEDKVFESTHDLDISIDDSRLGEVGSSEKKVAGVSHSSGQYREGVLQSSSMQGIERRIVIENNGKFPVENLLIEYQSFAEQQIIKYPKDFPVDYRCVGLLTVKSVPPGEKISLPLKLPDVVSAKLETFESDGYTYYQKIPSDCHQTSSGRMNGVWLKVSRITPYGERLVREYKSAGVPSTEWSSVAPISATMK